MKDSRDLAACHPELRPKVEELIRQFWTRFQPFGLIPVFTQRTPATQDALWAQGRGSLEATNALRRVAGLPPITKAENAHQVTWTRRSRHCLVPSEAVDLVVTVDPDGPTGPIKPVIQWEDRPRYTAMGTIAENLGLVWGGNWGDAGHVELPRKAAA